MIEEWKRWKPLSTITDRYYIDSVCNDTNGLTIVLSEDRTPSQRLSLCFTGWVHAYRQTDETFRARLIHELDKKYGTPFYSEWSLFTVTHSSYLLWLSEESSTISDAFEVTHFVILDPNGVIDIASSYEPIVTEIVGRAP